MTVRELVAMLLTMNQNLEVRFEDTYGLEMHYGDDGVEDVTRPFAMLWNVMTLYKSGTIGQK